MCVPIHTHIHLMNKKINMKNARRGPGISLNGKDTFILCQIVILIPKSALEVRLVLMHTQEAPGGNSGSQVPASQVGDVA